VPGYKKYHPRLRIMNKFPGLRCREKRPDNACRIGRSVCPYLSIRFSGSWVSEKKWYGYNFM